MKRVVWALAFVWASHVSAAPLATVLGAEGKLHGTGLLLRPAGEKPLGAVHYQPATEGVTFEDYYSSKEDGPGYVTSVKDQGQCGSCYAFARAKALEAAMIVAGKATKETINVAEQDTLVNDKSAYGCDGGFMDMNYETSHGLTSETQCPYKANDRYSCKSDPVVAKAVKWAYCGAPGRVPTTDEVKACLKTYKVVAVDTSAGGRDWSNGGVMTACNSRGINHMVIFYGWRVLPNGHTRWLGENQWGIPWGDNGDFEAETGCNQFLSTADSALFAYVEPDAPGPGPGPEPEPVTPAPLDLPYEVIVPKGKEVIIETPSHKATTSYVWSTGIKSYRLRLQTTTSTDVTLKATDRQGNVTQQTVKVTTK